MKRLLFLDQSLINLDGSKRETIYQPTPNLRFIGGKSYEVPYDIAALYYVQKGWAVPIN